ncbi:hypothetical protein AB0K09_21595 [Streptomyces sp. NPDC049577]|uniref:hypothetical protein n=1 Tax=Streptomyces sp. NPDC049577 TaxID=3155153 RepID=UPI003414A095
MYSDESDHPQAPVPPGTDAPEFVRQRYGNRWVYQHRNTTGLAIVVIAPIVAVAALLVIAAVAPR